MDERINLQNDEPRAWLIEMQMRDGSWGYPMVQLGRPADGFFNNQNLRVTPLYARVDASEASAVEKALESAAEAKFVVGKSYVHNTHARQLMKDAAVVIRAERERADAQERQKQHALDGWQSTSKQLTKETAAHNLTLERVSKLEETVTALRTQETEISQTTNTVESPRTTRQEEIVKVIELLEREASLFQTVATANGGRLDKVWAKTAASIYLKGATTLRTCLERLNKMETEMSQMFSESTRLSRKVDNLEKNNNESKHRLITLQRVSDELKARHVALKRRCYSAMEVLNEAITQLG